jgi:hypothetical protein
LLDTLLLIAELRILLLLLLYVHDVGLGHLRRWGVAWVADWRRGVHGSALRCLDLAEAVELLLVAVLLLLLLLLLELHLVLISA